MHSPHRGSLPAPASQSVLDSVFASYNSRIVIVSPPRCSSTAFARVFWQHPSVGFYAHEPFETTYYRNDDLTGVASRLQHALNLSKVQPLPDRARGNGLVIKEMPYQAGANFPLLAQAATVPVIFLLRDPRRNIASRMAKKREVGDSTNFPARKTGWELLREQISYLPEAGDCVSCCRCG